MIIEGGKPADVGSGEPLDGRVVDLGHDSGLMPGQRRIVAPQISLEVGRQILSGTSVELDGGSFTADSSRPPQHEGWGRYYMSGVLVVENTEPEAPADAEPLQIPIPARASVKMPDIFQRVSAAMHFRRKPLYAGIEVRYDDPDFLRRAWEAAGDGSIDI